jgi:GxxExxY protein
MAGGMPLVTTPLATAVIGCAIRTHRELGPGLLESAYQQGFTLELVRAGISFEREVVLPVRYKGTQLDCGLRLDFVIERQLIGELKSVERLLPVHGSQALTYLRLSGLRQALLINFNVAILRHGIKSFLWTPPADTQPITGGSGRH